MLNELPHRLLIGVCDLRGQSGDENDHGDGENNADAIAYGYDPDIGSPKVQKGTKPSRR